MQYGKGFNEMQLIYLIDIFQTNYNIVRDRFERDSINLMKNRPLVAKKQRQFQYILAWLSFQKTMKIVTRNIKKFKSFVSHTGL